MQNVGCPVPASTPSISVSGQGEAQAKHQPSLRGVTGEAPSQSAIHPCPPAAETWGSVLAKRHPHSSTGRGKPLAPNHPSQRRRRGSVRTSRASTTATSAKCIFGKPHAQESIPQPLEWWKTALHVCAKQPKMPKVVVKSYKYSQTRFASLLCGAFQPVLLLDFVAYCSCEFSWGLLRRLQQCGTASIYVSCWAGHILPSFARACF